MKPVLFLGDSLDALRKFSPRARQRAGYQIERVQRGLDPEDGKPMASIGTGVREIRVRDDSGAFHVLYVTAIADTIYVVHCFQKKTARTNRVDIELSTRRYKELMRAKR